MAVTFNPVGGDSITIGGTAATGPFPKYSVSTERVEASDGTLIDMIYSISVTGQVIATGDMTTAGARQDSLHAAMIAKLSVMEDEIPVGTLEIVAYGGLSNVLQFNDATLTSISFGEQDDDTAGTQVGDYTFEFTAHKRSSTKTGSSYSLASAEESWDISENSERYYESNTLTNLPSKTYTITHTVSATGYNKITDTTFNDSGWAQAKDWVLSRLVTTPATTIETNVAGKERFTDFQGIYMGESSGDFIDLGTDSAYNHSRVAQSDLPGGSYSITETWYISKLAVTHDFDMSLDAGEDGVTNVTVNGTIQGLNTSSFATRSEDKLTQAEGVLDNCLTQAYGLANSFYTASVTSTVACPLALNTSEMSKSISKNKTTGVITYSLSYNDKGSASANTITENLQISDDNEDRTNNVVAIIQIIGKADGPIFQNMGTTTERTRSASLEWTMKVCDRSSKPSTEALLAVNAYKPTGAYQLSKSESWTPSTGGYTLSIEWTY
jgi:hypothetical protein